MHDSTNAPLGIATPDAQPAPRRGRRAVAAIATTVGVAAVVSSAIATPAVAASRYAVWDRVSACESSHRWHINTGNGYYGGLQFSASTWAGYGGHRYAGQASGATRLQQIEVARRVLASQGPHAWPVCGPRAGLTRGNGHATRAPLPRVAGRSTHKARHHAVRHHTVRHHTVRHRPAAHRHTHRLRHHHGATYRVRRGDTLARIAQRLHVHGGWRALYRANRQQIHNPNLVYVGQLLRLP